MGSSRLRVLHISESAFGGGSESVFRDTIKGLHDALGDNIDLAVACRDEREARIKIHYPFASAPKGRIRKLFSQIFSIRNYKRLKYILKTFHPNIVHIQNYGNLSPSILAAVFHYKKSRPVKVIHTVHTYEYTCSHHAGFDYRLNKRCVDCNHQRYKFKIFYRGCSRLGRLHAIGKGITSLIASFYIQRNVIDQWISPSEFLQTLMIESGRFNSVNISVIRNPINNELVSESAHADLLTDERCREFVYFGRFSIEKNLECLIHAFHKVSQVTNCRLTLIGRGEEKINLERLVLTLGLTHKVSFLDFVVPEQLAMRLRQYGVAVMTSKCFENAPMVVNESILSDLIPIVPQHGGMLEMIEVAECGLIFESDNVDSLAEMMLFALTNYKKLYAEVLKAKSKIMAIYNNDKYVSEILNIYEK